MLEPMELETFEAKASGVADTLKALGNARRLMLLCKMVEHGEVTVGDLARDVGLSQSACSQHLARMRDGVRMLTMLGERPEFGDIVTGMSVPPGDIVGDDRALDDWIRTDVTTGHHISCTNTMGVDSNPRAVVEQLGAWRGVSALVSMRTRRPSTTAMAVTRKWWRLPARSSMSMASPRRSSSSRRQWVSRWPELRLTPISPGRAGPSTWPGPKAMVRPLPPASTVMAAPRRGTSRRATGQVSAQGHGRACSSPAWVRAQASPIRICASQALAWM